MLNKPLVVIVGPTASGKSALAMRIAQNYGGEIVCADSRTIYRGMDIGTAKPTKADRRKVPHHLIDIIDPNQNFSAADFKRYAKAAIADIRRRGKLPILVGGTGLYINAVIFDYIFGPPADPAQRFELSQKSIEQLQQICRLNNTVLPTNYLNKRHLIRAIETRGIVQQSKKLIPNTIIVGVTTQRDTLELRIRLRADAMFDNDVLKEAALLGNKYGWDNEALKGNIYRVLKDCVVGDKTLKQAKFECIQSDLKLAKRQLTWFKANPHIQWGTSAQSAALLNAFLGSSIKLSQSFVTMSSTNERTGEHD